jgi:hypothetical protein
MGTPNPTNVSITGVGVQFPSSGTFDLDAAAPVLSPAPDPIDEPMTCDDPNCPFCRDEDGAAYEPGTTQTTDNPTPAPIEADTDDHSDVPEMEEPLVRPRFAIVVGVLILLGIAIVVFSGHPQFLIHSR